MSTNKYIKMSEMREDIAAMYPDAHWKIKCLYIFPPRQVAAIYKNHHRKKRDGEQISFWDLGVLKED